MAESTETRHENWLRVVWGLVCVREGLQEYVDTKSKQQYQTFRNNVNAKCNNQTCDICQINSKCHNGRYKVTGKSTSRPSHFCDEMYKVIQNNHDRHNPFWINTDSTKWQDPHVGYWEVAKCYLSTAGFLDKTVLNQVDTSGLLSICINSLFIKQHIQHIQPFEELKNIITVWENNTTLYDAPYELDGQTADDCLDKMITVLEDPKQLIHDKFAKQAANQIRKIKTKTGKTPAIITQALHKRLQTNLDVNKSLKEIEDLIGDMLPKILQGFVEDAEAMVERDYRNTSSDDIYDRLETSKTTAGEQIRINYAGVETLKKLPGIGEKRAKLIVHLREEKGNITKESLEQLIMKQLSGEELENIDFARNDQKSTDKQQKRIGKDDKTLFEECCNNSMPNEEMTEICAIVREKENMYNFKVSRIKRIWQNENTF